MLEIHHSGREPSISTTNATNCTYTFSMAPTLEDEDVGIDVLHLQPAANGQCRICPDPVHQRPQLQQEWNGQKPEKYGTKIFFHIPHKTQTQQILHTLSAWRQHLRMKMLAKTWEIQHNDVFSGGEKDKLVFYLWVAGLWVSEGGGRGGKEGGMCFWERERERERERKWWWWSLFLSVLGLLWSGGPSFPSVGTMF